MNSLPLLLLPGMMCDARLFTPQIAVLGNARTLHFPTLSGAATIEGLARQILANAPPRFSLAGLSMGGIIAMEMMTQEPERIARLALLDTNPCAELPEIRARRCAQIDRVRAGALIEVVSNEMKPNYLADRSNSQAILDLCMQMALDLGPDIFVIQSRALRDRHDRRETLRKIRVPTLILCGREDRLCPVARHEFMHGLIPGASLEVIEDAGHLPVLEQPQLTNEALSRWIRL